MPILHKTAESLSQQYNDRLNRALKEFAGINQHTLSIVADVQKMAFSKPVLEMQKNMAESINLATKVFDTRIFESVQQIVQLNNQHAEQLVNTFKMPRLEYIESAFEAAKKVSEMQAHFSQMTEQFTRLAQLPTTFNSFNINIGRWKELSSTPYSYVPILPHNIDHEEGYVEETLVPPSQELLGRTNITLFHISTTLISQKTSLQSNELLKVENTNFIYKAKRIRGISTETKLGYLFKLLISSRDYVQDKDFFQKYPSSDPNNIITTLRDLKDRLTDLGFKIEVERIQNHGYKFIDIKQIRKRKNQAQK